MTLLESYRHGGIGHQKHDTHRGPATSYRQMDVPAPPAGSEWKQDPTTKEWTLHDKKGPPSDIPIVAVGNYQHVVQPTDTFQGICLQYKVTPTQLRQANGFSGTNLLLGPTVLSIPGKPGEIPPPMLVLTREQQMTRLRNSVPGIVTAEAKAYLELNNWNLEEAIQNAKEDFLEIEHH